MQLPEITLSRFIARNRATCGAIFIAGRFICFTLEDEKRLQKVYGQTCIPDGRYEVEVSNSPRFGRMLPELLDVPGFTGIRIHPGNDIDDSRGCVLVGLGLVVRQDAAMLRYSGEAVEIVINEIAKLSDGNSKKVFINVVSDASLSAAA